MHNTRHRLFTKKLHVNHLDKDKIILHWGMSMLYVAILSFMWASKNKNMWVPPSSSVNIWLHNGVKLQFWLHYREHLTFCSLQRGENSFPAWRHHFKHIKLGIVSFLRNTYDLKAAWGHPFLTHFNRAFDPGCLPCRHLYLGPAWSCHLKWAKHDSWPLSPSIGHSFDKDHQGSVIFRDRRTHTGKNEM